MRLKGKTSGFTLIELLIVIAIIGILAAVLIPNLLQARRRAFDTAAQTCLKEIGAQEEMLASIDPWEYTSVRFNKAAAGIQLGFTHDTVADTMDIGSCEGVIVVGAAPNNATFDTTVPESFYAYNAAHQNGGNNYHIEMGRGVVFHSEFDSTAGVPTTAVP